MKGDCIKAARSRFSVCVRKLGLGDPRKILQAVQAMGIKTQSMPFGSLSRATLDEAKSLLGDIKVAIEEL